jgi:hypothetical protein
LLLDAAAAADSAKTRAMLCFAVLLVQLASWLAALVGLEGGKRGRSRKSVKTGGAGKDGRRDEEGVRVCHS